MPKAGVLVPTVIIMLIASCAMDINRYKEAMPKGMSVCADCHVSEKDGTPYGRGRALLGSAANLCTGCHAGRMSEGEHRVGVVQGSETVLPLYGGRVECPTCHEPHGLEGNAFLLRLPSAVLCQACHNK